MKSIYYLSVFSLVGSLYAQDVSPPSSEDEAAKKAPEKAAPKAQVIEEDPPVAPAKKEAKTSSKPVKKGKGKGNEDQSTELNEGMPPLSELTPLTPTPPEVEKPVNEGIQIQVEKSNGKAGGGAGNGEVKITSPWPAKPLDVPPLGWKYIPAPAGIEPYRTTVKLGDSDSVNLAITPYVLVPASDGRNVIRISEPGYQPSQNNLQQSTIGSILQQSTEEIERNERQTGAAIQRLQQLLSSLPKP